ncbi:M13 family metallopeptidase [Candidatus Marsarchaeota archaeon]|nr:M13 family metallopeptidase [Candidatus Marsarchaeota archaeon]
MDVEEHTGKENAAPAFSIEYMMPSVSPIEDFYTYAAGGWIRTHPVPPDKASYNAFEELTDWNLNLLRKIAERCRRKGAAQQNSYAGLVGNFYASVMNKRRIEELKFSPIEDMWERVRMASSIEELIGLVPQFHSAGVPVFFNSYSDADQKDSMTYAFYIDQGGLTLPDRDYYLSEAFSNVRDAYVPHVADMFMLKGVDKEAAKKHASNVMSIETALAKKSRARKDLRDPEKNYTRIDVSDLDKRYGRLALRRYLSELHVPEVKFIVVSQPEVIDALNNQLDTADVEALRSYMYWNVLHAYAPLLHREVDKENFNFFGRILMGQQKQRARWKRAISIIDSEIGEALGKLYVDKYFTEDAKRKALELVDDIISVVRGRLQNMAWMSDSTKKKAVEKLDKIVPKIGYPEKFRDYSSLKISPDDFAGNARRSAEFESRRQAMRVGGAVDRTEWDMTPPTVNAYYAPTENQIVFPAGIFQPPFFSAGMDYAVNYGGIGAVIGHEITHGFDDEGRKYDSDGNINNWWTKEDEERFKEKADTIVKEYSKQEPLPGFHINGELTLGENIADMGGISIAFEALQRRLAKDPTAEKVIDGLTQKQRFFIAYAQAWRQSIREEDLKRRLTTDPHSPAKYRVLIPVANVGAFYTAFASEGDKNRSRRLLGIW